MSAAEGYQVKNCHEMPRMEAIGREIGDYGAKAYDCDGGLGVIVEPDGRIADFPAPAQASSPKALTAAYIDARIIDQAKSQFGVTPKHLTAGQALTSRAELDCAA